MSALPMNVEKKRKYNAWIFSLIWEITNSKLRSNYNSETGCGSHIYFQSFWYRYQQLVKRNESWSTRVERRKAIKKTTLPHISKKLSKFVKKSCGVLKDLLNSAVFWIYNFANLQNLGITWSIADLQESRLPADINFAFQLQP